MFKNFFKKLFHRNKYKYNDKLTSKEIASKASKILRDQNMSPEAKKIAASALAQANRVESKETSREISALSSKIVKNKDKKYDENVTSIAGSVLSQSNKAKKNKK